MKGRPFRIVLIWLLIAAGSWVYAQDTPVLPGPATSGPENEEADEQESKVVDAPAEVFIPTEEISEDAAVPFPVDI